MRSVHSIPWLLALMIVGFIFVAGCLGSVGGEYYGDDYINNLDRIAISHPDYIEECRLGSCTCMVCENGENIFGPMTSLIGGRCYFQSDCNKDLVRELGDDTVPPFNLSIRSFMIGQGPSFGDFSAANPYCSHRLNMAVQWLKGGEGTPYLMPDAARCMCFLSKDIIPVYVLYSEGKNINISRSRQIGRILGTGGRDVFRGRLTDGPVGPVIVVTEIDYNASQAHLVAEQVRAIDEACNDRENGRVYCMIAVAPKINDREALDLVMQEVGDNVDIVAYGVNGRHVHSCDGSRILRQALSFSSYALYNWSKPSLIPYVMFDNVGTDVDNSCNWTENRMTSAYAAFFPTGILSLQQRGLIGIAPYSFNSTLFGISNPLQCADCGVGRSQQRLRSWYAWCQSYTNITRKAPTGETTSHPSGATPIVFPNESGGYCDFTAQLDYLFREISFGDAASSRDFMNPRNPEVRAPTEQYFACDACLLSGIELREYFAFQASEDLSATQEACTIFPEVNVLASERNIDPMLLRAFLWVESNFEPCAAARVCRLGYEGVGTDGRGCFQSGPGEDECYFKGFTWMEDPREALGEEEFCTFDNAVSREDAMDSDVRPNWRWCALGTAQGLVPPYTYWPASHLPEGEDGEHLELYQDANLRRTRYRHSLNSRIDVDAEKYWGDLDLARSCNPEFNPFSASDSICYGAAALEKALAFGRNWVADPTNRAKIGIGADEYDKQAIFAAYVAGHQYTGFWSGQTRRREYDEARCLKNMSNGDCWVKMFEVSREITPAYCTPAEGDPLPHECSDVGEPDVENCYGYSDFVLYLRDCELQWLKRDADPGAKRMSVYFWLMRNCEQNFCPDGRRLVSAMCEDDGTGNYNEDLCSAPGVPRVPSSGTYYVRDDTEDEEEDEEEEAEEGVAEEAGEVEGGAEEAAGGGEGEVDSEEE